MKLLTALLPFLAVRTFRLVTLATVVIAVAACAIQSTDLSPIKVGASRATVESVLGSPVKSVQTDSGRIDTYKYNMGYTPPPSRPGGSGGGCGPYLLGCVAVLAIVGPIAHGIHYGRQRGDIEVTYGPQDTVVWVGTTRVRQRYEEAEQGNAEAQFNLGTFYYYGQGVPQDYAEAVKWYRKAADLGHAEAQYTLAGLLIGRGETQEAIKLLCLAASHGHAAAPIRLGSVYGDALAILIEGAKGHTPTEPDLVRAYVWYSLAISKGHLAAAYGLDLAGKMTPAQIAEAERLAKEWKPGDCGAEGSPTKSTG